MEGFAACSGTSGRFVRLLPPTSSGWKHRDRFLRGRGSNPFPRYVCRGEGGGGGGQQDLNQWDLMELKFGRLLGEDPNLTMAKVMGRKANPDVSYLDIEKSFRKKKGAMDYGEEMSSGSTGDDLAVGGKPLRSPEGLQVPRRPENSSGEGKLNLVRPAMDGKMKAAISAQKRSPASPTQARKPDEKIDPREGAPDVALRKPTLVHEDDIEMEKSSKLRLKPNLVLKMRKGPAESLRDVSLRKPEVMKISLDSSIQETTPSGDAPDENVAMNDSVLSSPSMMAGTSHPEPGKEREYSDDGDVTEGMMDSALAGSPSGLFDFEPSEDDAGAEVGIQLSKHLVVGSEVVEEAPVSSVPGPSQTVAHESMTPRIPLHGRPRRQENLMEDVSHTMETTSMRLRSKDDDVVAVAAQFATSGEEEHEAGDWRKVEDYLKTGERIEVELVSCSSSGFVVSFGSLIGFLPYRSLGAKWKFLAFESWLRKKGLDPSLYRQNLSIMGSYDIQKNSPVDSTMTIEDGCNDKEKLSLDMKFEELFAMYDQEKNNFLSSFVGQMIRVSVVYVDQKSRKLMFSGKPKEKQEVVERKRSLMATLSIGDVVKCCIRKITFFGIFVEVEGVPALIHQSEISWDEALDPFSFFKIGQILDAKVHQLDYSLERITLSLKEITPDPLNETLESVIGGGTSLDGRLVTAQADEEWADVESLIKELLQVDGVHGVTKGRFFLSPGLAPTFQVYMASMYESQYKLLARYGNKVQEVLVQSSMGKEQMKTTILACTNRVA